MNNKTIEIVKVEQISEDFFYIVKWNGGQETIAQERLLELAGRPNVEIVYDEENEDLEQTIENSIYLYMEVNSPLGDEEGYEVYEHSVRARYGELSVDVAGTYVKTYKTYKGAMNYAKKQSSLVVEN